MNQAFQTQHGFVPDLPGLEIDKMLVRDDQVTIYAVGKTTEACCPDCHLPSQRIHSHYTRCPQDLPLSGKSVRLHLRLKRFRCSTPWCHRQTFVEPLLKLVAQRSQRTLRCEQVQYWLALGTGGAGGARLLKQLGLSVSDDTLLRMICRAEAPHFDTPRLLGVDDWAWRKGTRYGTVLCDLEKRCIVDILPDRDQNTFAAWLKRHPGVEVITRDRAKYYIEGANEGAPQAQQVADRWHLLANLRETLLHPLHQHRDLLSWRPPLPPDDPNAQALSRSVHAEQRRLHNHQRKVARHEQILALRQQRYGVHEIAVQLGISSRTVYRWLNRPIGRERRHHPKPEPQLLPFADYLSQRFNAGFDSYRSVFRDLQKLGYTGTYDTVRIGLKRLETGLKLLRTPPPKVPKKVRLTPSKAVWLFVLDPKQLRPHQAVWLGRILNHPKLKALYELVQRFCVLVRARQPADLLPWMEAALNSEFKDLVSFVHGLQQDLAAVHAALSTTWSNGPVEGHINRLKLIKRQMYGRASFTLLRARLLNPF